MSCVTQAISNKKVKFLSEINLGWLELNLCVNKMRWVWMIVNELN